MFGCGIFPQTVRQATIAHRVRNPTDRFYTAGVVYQFRGADRPFRSLLNGIESYTVKAGHWQL